MKKLLLFCAFGILGSPLLSSDNLKQSIKNEQKQQEPTKKGKNLWLIPVVPLAFQAIMVSAICAVQPEARTYFVTMLNDKNYFGLLQNFVMGYLYSAGLFASLVGCAVGDIDIKTISGMSVLGHTVGWCSAFGNGYWKPDMVPLKVNSNTPDWMYIGS